MKNHPDVMKALAEARPAQLDPPRTPPFPFPLPDRTVTGRRHRRFRAAALIPAGALAAAAVTAVAVVAIDPGGPAPTPHGPGASVEAAQPLAASQILLTAAERSTEDAPRSGRYLVVRRESGSVITVGSGTATYEMTAKSSQETWLSRSGEEPTWVTFQKLGLTPLTPADAAAWRAAGSPEQVMIGKPLPTGELGPGSAVSTSAGPRESSSWGADLYALGDTSVSVRDLENLPTDPPALRTALLEHFHGGGGDLPTDRDQWLLAVASSLITDIPVSGPVRAAAFRLIATMPGVRSLGVVTDQRGREGQGFAFTSVNAASGPIERRFVIDLATGRALGEESRVLRPSGTTAKLKPGSLLGYSVVLEQRTTDETPPK
ncbi:CU044_5270 family protein [Actinoplanes aureus]|uniref:CU044_5270 family protein n=1 Tax=Actinoplanes aureus TaxID=2792083 RepID=A0A931CBX7_9ACTN|nr:CU044_5270 family protein [Actinoplanes aureus]MBG0567249.1 CU044_5270 family protein [Actinoplanes aureus]